MTDQPNGPLLRADDYDAAPDDDFQAFIFLEERARERMYLAFEEDINGNKYYPMRGEYMTRVAGLAATYEIPGIEFNPGANLDNEFYSFIKDVDFQTTQIGAGLSRQRKRSSIEFESTEKAKIRRALNQIKKCIDDSEVNEKRKRALLARIHEFEAELDKTKSSTAIMATAALVILATTADLKTIGVDISEAAGSLVELVGRKRLDIDEETQLQLAPPLKLIEPPKAPEVKSQTSKGYDDLDDDIPF